MQLTDSVRAARISPRGETLVLTLVERPPERAYQPFRFELRLLGAPDRTFQGEVDSLLLREWKTPERRRLHLGEALRDSIVQFLGEQGYSAAEIEAVQMQLPRNFRVG